MHGRLLLRGKLCSCTPDRNFRFFYPCEIIRSHIPVSACGKDNKQSAACWLYSRKVVVTFKLCHCIQDFLRVFFMFSNIKGNNLRHSIDVVNT